MRTQRFTCGSALLRLLGSYVLSDRQLVMNSRNAGFLFFSLTKTCLKKTYCIIFVAIKSRQFLIQAQILGTKKVAFRDQVDSNSQKETSLKIMKHENSVNLGRTSCSCVRVHSTYFGSSQYQFFLWSSIPFFTPLDILINSSLLILYKKNRWVPAFYWWKKANQTSQEPYWRLCDDKSFSL